MAISIDWQTKIISIPKSDLTLTQSDPFEVRELDLNWFRLQLKDLEDSDEGMTFPDTHRHNTEVTLGGLTFARVIEVINGYTVSFENGHYAVNLVGANSNVGDVTNLNEVSVRTANSAGLIISETADIAAILDAIGVATLDDQEIEPGMSLRNSQRLILSALAGILSGAEPGSTTIIIKNSKVGGGAKNRIVATVDAYGNRSELVFDLTPE